MRVDASIAIASTVAVTSPNWSGLAGDSTWLYYNAKRKENNSHRRVLNLSRKN